MLPRGKLALRIRVCAVMLGAAALSVGAASPVHAADARHYEKISPADKGKGDIVGDGGTNVASTDGNAVTLSTRTPFGDTIGSGVSGQTQYVARRTATAWAVHSITPQPRAAAYQTIFGATRYQAYSDDLSRAVLFGYDLPGTTGGVPLRNNLYVEDTASRALQPVTMAQNGLPSPLPNPVFEMSRDFNWGISADARHVAFVSRVPYLPQAAPGGVPNVYQWDDGVLSLAGVLPDGSVPARGSDVVPATEARSIYRAAMSADGTRLLFTANRQLFMRINGTSTVQVSESEMDPNDPNYVAAPSGVGLRLVTPDGRTVVFTSNDPLLADDVNGTTDLYRYTDSANPSGDANLRRITDGFTGQVIGASDDGERIYYQTTADEIVVWDHGVSHVITSSVPIVGSARASLSAGASGPGLARVSPDGRYLAFGTDSAQLDGDGQTVGPTGEVTNGHREMYLYRLGGALECISCPSVPASSDATVAPEATTGVITYTMPGIRPRFLSDGGKVFFSTGEALVPQDNNGVADTYEYDPATDSLTLLSSGKGSDPATFAEASPSGDDVFFVTRQRLVGSDRDDLVDLYDARVGDPLPEPADEEPSPRCEGETCQPPPTGALPDDPLGSLTFDDGDGGVIGAVGLSARRSVVLHGSGGSLNVKLSAPGTLKWSGRGLRSGSVKRSRSGTVVVRLRLGRHARAQLRKSGAYTTSVHLTLTSADGNVTRTTRVTFRAAAKRGR